MVKRVLALISLLLINTSIYAMDLNETTTIIHKASKATEVLQDEFDTLLNDISIPTRKEVIELNNTTPQLINSIEIMEVNKTIELNNTIPTLNKEKFETNESIEINSTITPKEINTTNPSNCNDNNSSIVINGLSINLDANNTTTDNGCTDANLGRSIRGLIIFKTNIKPYCEMSGETFSKQYMQEDWDDIYHEKEFKMEVIKACPNIEEEYDEKWTPHLYQFAVEYASDSDSIPEC